MKLRMSSRCQPSVVRDSMRALVARSATTMNRVTRSQRTRVGKVTRISLTSEIEERSLHYEPANYAGSPVGMTSFLVGCKSSPSKKRKSSRRSDRTKHGHDISCPYGRNRIFRSCGGSVCGFDFGEGGGAAFADGWV